MKTSALTESINPNSRDIDRKSIPEILKIINCEDQTVAAAVCAALPAIVLATEMALRSLESGGRLIYAGAGTSGRIGMMDAAECRPTYGVSEDTVCAVIAGGPQAMISAIEEAEDDDAAGIGRIAALNIKPEDTVIGLSASGRTSFVAGALLEARRRGASTVAIICNETGRVLENADVAIRLLTGPEVIVGSTRMKAATAQKMTVNMISTAAMIKFGKVTGNFMTEMNPKNSKLRERAAFITSNVCRIPIKEAELLLEAHQFNIKETVASTRIREAQHA